MIQLDAIILYSQDGRQREIRFRPGELNIITGASGTGKSSIIGILRFLLGGTSPKTTPLISKKVAWYGLSAHAGNTRFFVGRPSPPFGSETELAMLSVGSEEVPDFSLLKPNCNISELIPYLGNLNGITENLHIPSSGQTRRPLEANFRHSLYYNFQQQNEIANPELLFHHQNLDFQKQAIRDTFPYFLGAQGSEFLQKRRILSDLRRDIRHKRAELEESLSERREGVDPAIGLISDAVACGLLDETIYELDLESRIERLKNLLNLDHPVVAFEETNYDSQIEQLIDRRIELREDLQNVGARFRSLNEFAQVNHEYDSELDEHRARLASIGLVPEASEIPAVCPICRNTIVESASIDTIKHALGDVAKSIEFSKGNQPRVSEVREELTRLQNQIRADLAAIDAALEDLIKTDTVQRESKNEWGTQSFVRGRISQYFQTFKFETDEAIGMLEHTIQILEEEEVALSDEIDTGAIRSKVDALLGFANTRMTSIAQNLQLENSEHSTRIDPYRLTIVADTLDGPAYMDEGAIGSGMSWVGYHLAAYLALHEYFIEKRRPVSRFIVFDQPSQAFFPRERKTGGDLNELNDVDRKNTRDLYLLMFEQVKKHDGLLQIIAFDHADFEDEWFQESIIDEPWRDGNALIPADWL